MHVRAAIVEQLVVAGPFPVVLPLPDYYPV